MVAEVAEDVELSNEYFSRNGNRSDVIDYIKNPFTNKTNIGNNVYENYTVQLIWRVTFRGTDIKRIEKNSRPSKKKSEMDELVELLNGTNME